MPEELVEKQNVSLEQAQQLIMKKALEISPPLTNLWTFYQKNGGLLTHSPLDLLLPDGIPTGTITEISGPSGTGKTQLCFLAAIESKNTIFIDTEGSFSATRLKEMAEQRGKNIECLSTIKVLKALTIHDVFDSLEIAEWLLQENPGLLILDSLATPVKHDFDTDTLEAILKRNVYLAKISEKLKWLASHYSIPVLVTNLMFFQQEKDTYVTLLGNSWHHSVNTRIEFIPHHEHYQMTLAKSPMYPIMSIDYSIQCIGLENL